MRHRILYIVIALLGAGCGLAAEEHARYASPDSAFVLVVYRYPRVYAMPGQGSDAPGFVELQDREGKRYEKQKVEMVQLVETPEWTAERVRVKLILDWKLPSPRAPRGGPDR